jgi:hypothetical protein
MKTTHDHTALNALKAKTAEIEKAIASELSKAKADLADLETPASKAKYSPEFLKSQHDHITRKAKESAQTHQNALRDAQRGLEAARAAWSTENVLKRAAAAPVGDGMEAIVHELRQLRLGADARDARGAELTDLIEAAKESKNLAGLMLLSREVNRRTGIEHMTATAAIESALEAFAPEGQAAALQILDDAQRSLEDASDFQVELETGKQTPRGHMRATMKKQAEQRDEQPA